MACPMARSNARAARSGQTARKAVGTRQRSGMQSGRWAETAQPCFWPNLAPNLKMLPSGRR
eukprot:6476581-Prymnesium_polylepis.1